MIETTRELYDAFNRGDIEAILARLDPEVEIHDPDRTGTTHRGPEGYRAFIEEWLESWEWYSVEVREVIRNGDHVLVDLVQAGVGKGSGIEVTQPFTQVLTFRDGKVARFMIFAERADGERAAGLRD